MQTLRSYLTSLSLDKEYFRKPLQALADAHPDVTRDGTIYTNLECITKEAIEATKPMASLYLLKIYKDSRFINKCKIGITTTIEERIASIEEESGLTFKLHLISTPLSNPRYLEGGIHKLLKEKNLWYQTSAVFTGCTEIFHYQDWMDNLIP